MSLTCAEEDVRVDTDASGARNLDGGSKQPGAHPTIGDLDTENGHRVGRISPSSSKPRTNSKVAPRVILTVSIRRPMVSEQRPA